MARHKKVEVTTLSDSEPQFIDGELLESKSDQEIVGILLSIVDALYDKDGDAATWKPIRDSIEKL